VFSPEMILPLEAKFPLTWSGNNIEDNRHQPHSRYSRFTQHRQDTTALKRMKMTSPHTPSSPS